jgi:hypothetical protein
MNEIFHTAPQYTAAAAAKYAAESAAMSTAGCS